jgi:maltose/moltooligosaccharide transporter
MLAIQKKMSNTFYALLSLPATAVGFCLSTQVAALSWILSTKYELQIEDVALVWLAGPLSGIIAQPIVGMMSDRSWFMGGRRKPFIIIGGILGAVMLLALPQMDLITEYTGLSIFSVAIMVSLLLDMNVNVTMNPARAIIADVTKPGAQRTKGYSRMQLVSGSFGVGAYFISVSFGNIALIYLAAVVVLLFSIIPVLFVREPRILQQEISEQAAPQTKSSFIESLKVLLPLYGFAAFAVYIIINHLILNGRLSFWQSDVMYACLIVTLIIGIRIFIKARRKSSDKLEFQKILLAHSFTWLGIQSMFIMCFFYVKENMIPGMDTESALANQFSSFFTGAEVSDESTAGNVLSLGFLFLNFVGALLPALILEPLSLKIGKVKVYRSAIAFMCAGYFFLYIAGSQELNFYLGMIICGIGWSAAISIVFAIMTEKVNANKMGLYMGIFNFSVVLPAMMTPGMAGIIEDSGDSSTLFLIIFCSLLLSLICWMTIKEEKSKTVINQSI